MAGSDTDSDWDSTLDITSPRQRPWQLPPRIQLEIEEEGDPSVIEDIPNPKSGSNLNHIEVNGHADMSQREEKSSKLNTPRKGQRQSELKDDTSPQTPRKQRQSEGQQPPPYNFKGVPTDPEPSEGKKEVQRPGKAKKGNTYDVVASLTPRPIKNTDSFRSTGSWDDSDAEDRTLREVRETFSKQRQIEKTKEAEKQKNEPSDDTSHLSRTNQNVSGQTSLARMFAANPKRGIEQQQSRNVQHKMTREESKTVDAILPQIKTAQMYKSPTSDAEDLFEQQTIDQIPKPLTELIVRNEEERRYIYHFGHGNFKMFEAGEDDIEAIMPSVADKTEKVIRRIYREVFGVLRIITGIFIWFIVELLQYVIQHVIQPLFIGVILVVADHLVKPTLSLFFSGIVQPFNIFWWNVMVGVRHVSRPIIDIIGSFAEIFALLLRSFRLFEINRVITDRSDETRRVVHDV